MRAQLLALAQSKYSILFTEERLAAVNAWRKRRKRWRENWQWRYSSPKSCVSFWWLRDYQYHAGICMLSSRSWWASAGPTERRNWPTMARRRGGSFGNSVISWFALNGEMLRWIKLCPVMLKIKSGGLVRIFSDWTTSSAIMKGCRAREKSNSNSWFLSVLGMSYATHESLIVLSKWHLNVFLMICRNHHRMMFFTKCLIWTWLLTKRSEFIPRDLCKWSFSLIQPTLPLRPHS